MTVRIGPLDVQHRAQLGDLLAATRVFSAEEIGVALELFDETFGEKAGPSLRSGRQPYSAGDALQERCRPERSEGPALAITQSDYEFVAAFDNANDLVGYACYGPTPMTEGTWDLYWLAVHPAAQGAGVGRALVDHVEAELALCDARLLVVETSSRSDYAHTRAFYARLGFQEAAVVRDFYAPADDRIILTTRLYRERGVVTR